MSRPCTDRSPTSLWLARLLLLGIAISAVGWMAGWVAKYARF